MMRYNILQYLEDTTESFRDKPAFCDNKESFTFGQLVDASRRIGTSISGRIAPGNAVVVYMEKRASNIAAFFGIVYAGCFYVPIDKDMPVERVRIIIGTLSPAMIIFDDATADNAGSFDDDIIKIHYDDAVRSGIDSSKLDAIRGVSKSTDLLYVLFTSGSTGVPKGVTISHLAVIDFAEWIVDKYSLDSMTTLCNQAPFYFDASVPDIFIPLLTGATVYIPPKMYYTFPKKILNYIEENNINTLVWVPSALCNVVNCRAFEVTVPTKIRLVIFCGEVMPCKHLNVWRKYIPDALYVNMYGPTEATYACMYYDIEREFADDEKLPLGKACENSEILLITDDRISENGEIGEICILGQCLSNGYYNAPEKTAEVFVQNPVNDKWMEIMYRTGDLACIKDGDIVFAGRKDFQIKRLGHRIEMGEIENAILSGDGVENACCLYNEESGDLIAVYTGKIETEDLMGILEDKLPGYMIPTRTIRLDAMPMNLNGKIDRTKLKTEYAEG